MNESPDSTINRPLLALGALTLAALVGVGAFRWSGMQPLEPAQSPVTASRELRFDDRPDGGVAVSEASSGRLVETIAPGTNGFLRGALRGLARERKRSDASLQAPFLLAAHADGRLTLMDPTTGRHIDLESFGPTNAAVFLRLLGEPPQQRLSKATVE